MNMSKKNEKREVKKDQLLPEWGFIRFCNEDQANTYVGGRMDINEHFLKAAEKDELIKPLLQIKEKQKQNDGTEKEVLVKYYSPYQIYILAELRKNILDEDGNLRAPDTIDWYKERPKEQRPRYISWGGGMSFWADNPKKRDREDDELWVGAHLVSDYLYRFLELLHSLEQPKEHYYLPIEKRRYWNNAPITEYDFTPLKNGKKLLSTYGLDEHKLNILRKNVGQFTEVIDPLAHWHYYIERHPEWKKDLLKGDASLAQDLYRLYHLLTEAWEALMGKKSEPIFEFIHKDFPHHPFWRPKVEYVGGEDIKALQYSVQQFKKWKLKKANKPFVSNNVADKIKKIEQELSDYEKKYGDRSYAGSYREVEPEKIIKVEDLGEREKRYATSILKQIKEQELNKKCDDEEKESWEEKVRNEISMAIMHGLGDLERELRQVFWDVSKQFNDRRSAAWQRINEWGSKWWWENREKLQGLSREEQLKLSREEMKKVRQEAKDWEERGSDFHNSVARYAEIVFCKMCRKKPVRQRSENPSSMWNKNSSLICDDCLADVRKNSLTTEDEWWKRVNQAEWKCKKCDKLLYKFVHGNILTALTRNNVPVKIEVEYGRAIMSAKCPQCRSENETLPVDWGWLP